MTECREQKLIFQAHGGRGVEAAFDGGMITSDGGALLLRELELQEQIVADFADCFIDHRDPSSIEFTVVELIRQRVFGLALGYEDLNDHDKLRVDPLLALLCGRKDVTGGDRRCAADKGKPLAGKSTLNRLELYSGDAKRDGPYKKIEVDEAKVDQFFIDHFFRSYRTIPLRIYLDLDATDVRIHGMQEGRYYHGYYDDYCYLPLYIFCDDELLCAKLRTSDKGGADGATEEVERIVKAIRKRWPKTEIVVRGDSGFCGDELMSWCEKQTDVYYVLGLAQNPRLLGKITIQQERAKLRCEISGQSARVFTEFPYATLKSWDTERRVVAKAEHVPGKANPRFVVTSLPEWELTWDGELIWNDAQKVYEKLYCARGEMENRIKEQQLDLFADRTSTHYFKSNQLRMWMASVGYMALNALRRTALGGTKLAGSYCGTIREELLKICAIVKVSVRRIYLSFSSAYPHADLFGRILARLRVASD